MVLAYIKLNNGFFERVILQYVENDIKLAFIKVK